MNDCELFLALSIEAPLIYLVVSGYGKRAGSAGCHYLHLLAPNEVWDDLRLKDTLLGFFFVAWERDRLYTIDLAVHVEAPGVQIRASVALELTEAAVVTDGVVAVAARGYGESVEIAQSHLIDLSVIELIELMQLGRGVVLVSYAQRSIYVRARHPELVE